MRLAVELNEINLRQKRVTQHCVGVGYLFFFFNAIYGIAVMEHSQSPRDSYSSTASGFKNTFDTTFST